MLTPVRVRHPLLLRILKGEQELDVLSGEMKRVDRYMARRQLEVADKPDLTNLHRQNRPGRTGFDFGERWEQNQKQEHELTRPMPRGWGGKRADLVSSATISLRVKLKLTLPSILDDFLASLLLRLGQSYKLLDLVLELPLHSPHFLHHLLVEK